MDLQSMLDDLILEIIIFEQAIEGLAYKFGVCLVYA